MDASVFQISDEDNEGLSPITGLLARDDHKVNVKETLVQYVYNSFGDG